MIIKKKVGIVSYGVSIPKFCLPSSEIEVAQGKEKGLVSKALGIDSKTVPNIDEDSITLATQAARQAINRFDPMKKSTINVLFVGSESHPYAVKPSGTVIAAALGLSPYLSMADLQFACKAGTQSLQISLSYVLAGLSKFGLAIGADTAQAAPGDALEFSAAAGAAAFLVGKRNLIAELLATTSVATDTPDFWRRPGEAYPRHAGRFTGKPAYFKHIYLAASALMKEAKIKPEKINYCVFHTPNSKFPQAIAKALGFKTQQLKPSLVVKKIGNTYAAASLLALTAVLDIAKANQTILVTSYGSGAGADSFLFKTTSLLEDKRSRWKKSLNKQIRSLKNINYEQYQKMIKEQSH